MDIREFVTISEVDDGAFIAGALFRHRFNEELVRFGRHYVALYRNPDGALLPVSYVHVTDCGEIGLVGGGCTDGRQLARMTAEQQLAVREAGGLLLQVLRYVFECTRNDFEALFGVCGNPRAYEVDLQAGFVPTEVPQLLVYCPHPVSDRRLEVLTLKARSFMPF